MLDSDRANVYMFDSSAATELGFREGLAAAARSVDLCDCGTNTCHQPAHLHAAACIGRRKACSFIK